MGANIITGYTGTRHITPAMDASVYRSVFGSDNYILSDGNQLAGSMPDINSFTVLDGLASMQGHQIQVTQETLSVDTCANGYSRIDLVCLRFEHDNSSSIDSTSLVVIKGTEVQDPNTPSVPDYNTGNIDSGASVVDMPLYQINLSGSSVTFERVAQLLPATLGTVSVVEEGSDGNWKWIKWSNGTVEAWYSEAINQSYAFTTHSGSNYYYTNSDWTAKNITVPTGVFSNIIDGAFANIQCNGYLSASCVSSSLTSIGVRAFTPYSININITKLSLYVVGA